MHDFYRWPGSLALILYGLSRPLLGADDVPFVGLTEASAEQFVAATLAANPALPAREAAWEAARARVAQATALDDPTLSYAFAPETLGDSEGESATPWSCPSDYRGPANAGCAAFMPSTRPRQYVRTSTRRGLN